MKKVLFVCMGNICRSAMAEGLLRDKVEQRGLAVTVDSAGTHGYHVGNAYDLRARAELAKHNISVEDLRSRQIQAADFEAFDVVFVADDDNLADLSRQFGNVGKHVVKMTAYSERYFNLNVPDPYYGGDEGFAEVYKMLDESIDAWLKTLS